MSDLELARKLERAEGNSNAAYVEAHALIDPGAGATWTEFAGAYAMFDGVGSPMTQSFGVGVFDAFGEPQFDDIENFFFSKGSPAHHEVCELAAPETRDLLQSRGYRPIEYSTVLIRSTDGALSDVNPRINVRQLPKEQANVWAKISADGWRSEGEEIAAFLEMIGQVIGNARTARLFVAEIDGQPIAAGALNITNGVALLAGASTIPEARSQGAQAALLTARLQFAREQGIDTAMIVTQPESGSNRNAKRSGFEHVYNRTKWKKSST